MSAALGPLADAVALGSVGQAVDAVTLLKSDDAGRAAMLVGGAAAPDRSTWPALPSGARWAVDLVGVPDELRGSGETALARVAVVDGLAAARYVLAAAPHLGAVTRDGDVRAARVLHG